MMIYGDFSKKCHVIFKKVFLFAFLKVLSYLVCVPSFKSINSSSPYRKKYDGVNFTSTPRQRLRCQNTLVEIGLIEFADLSDTLNCKPFKTLHITNYFAGIFTVYICLEQNLLFWKLSCILYFFDLAWGWNLVIHH